MWLKKRNYNVILQEKINRSPTSYNFIPINLTLFVQGATGMQSPKWDTMDLHNDKQYVLID